MEMELEELNWSHFWPFETGLTIAKLTRSYSKKPKLRINLIGKRERKHFILREAHCKQTPTISLLNCSRPALSPRQARESGGCPSKGQKEDSWPAVLLRV